MYLPYIMGFSVPHMYLSKALENMIEDSLTVTQLTLMGIPITLSQKTVYTSQENRNLTQNRD